MKKKSMAIVFSVMVAVAGLYLTDAFGKHATKKMGNSAASKQINSSISNDVPGRPSNEPQIELDELLGTNICLIDNFGNVYHLTLSYGIITGTAYSPYCINYSNVNGTYSGRRFVMHVDGYDDGHDDDDDDDDDDCDGFTYTGVYNRITKRARGTWVNDDNGQSGTFRANLCKT